MMYVDEKDDDDEMGVLHLYAALLTFKYPAIFLVLSFENGKKGSQL